MFIVSLTYIKPLEQVDKFIAEHIEYLDEQYRLGHFQLSGRKVPRTGGVILVTADSREQLDQILAQDPFYREELASYDVTEVVPSKASKALESLVES
ncbi:YciI family protein [Aliikangiella sp. G2MR2-5]|uniref:YciI family protein n=1 Tax=Aliikangiella sp. G2MR2-5 TaxID=2788943 RepID=UPI0018AC6F8F|nr:YciI family protein [Aliikangiella sp. G2MR2-5]